jgi:hypothetical protein
MADGIIQDRGTGHAGVPRDTVELVDLSPRLKSETREPVLLTSSQRMDHEHAARLDVFRRQGVLPGPDEQSRRVDAARCHDRYVGAVRSSVTDGSHDSTTDALGQGEENVKLNHRW